MTTHTTYLTKLDSSDYGEETWEHDSLGEAMASMERIIKSAGKRTNSDQIKRCVTLEIVNTITSAFAP